VAKKTTKKSGKPGKAKNLKRHDDTDSEADENYDDDEDISVEPEITKRKPNKTTNKRTQPGRSSKVSGSTRIRYVVTDTESEETDDHLVDICIDSKQKAPMQKSSSKKSKPNVGLGNTSTKGQRTKSGNNSKKLTLSNSSYRKRQVDNEFESESEGNENILSNSGHENVQEKPQPTNKKQKSESNLDPHQKVGSNRTGRGASTSKSKSSETTSSQNDSQNCSNISSSQQSATSNALAGLSPILRPVRASRNKKIQGVAGSVVLAGDLSGSVIADLSTIKDSPTKKSKGGRTKKGGLMSSTRLPDSKSKSRTKRRNSEDSPDKSVTFSFSKKSKSSSETSGARSSSVFSSSSVSSKGSSGVHNEGRQ